MTLRWEDTDVSSLRIDSKNYLIYGENDTDGEVKICNEYIVSGDFFKIPLGESELEVVKYPTNSASEGIIPSADDVKISYNYYYY